MKNFKIFFIILLFFPIFYNISDRFLFQIGFRRIQENRFPINLVSSKSIIQILRESGRPAVIMAVNPRSVPDEIIPAVLQAAEDYRVPIIFELAASEMNVNPDASLTAAYTGMTPAMLAEKVNYWVQKLGITIPYAIHGDHITVKKNTPEAIQAAKALIEAEVAAGFTSYAIDASFLMELDESKLVERLNAMTYEDLLLIPDLGEVLARRISTHGPFSSLEELKEIEGIGESLYQTIRTYLELKDNIDVTAELAKLIPEGAGLEVEVGEIGKVDPETGQQALTTVIEAVTFIKALHKRGIYPDMLAIHNGTAHGNAFDPDGNPIPQLGIDLQRTREIAEAIAPFGVGITQHGTTGTSMENLRLFGRSGIVKANVATNWQNIMWEHLPEEMKEKIIAWQWENLGEMRRKYSSDAEFLDKTRKYANKFILRGYFGKIPESALLAIFEEAYASAVEYFQAFEALYLLDNVNNFSQN